MDMQDVIPATVYCEQYQIEVSFIQALTHYGLLQTEMDEGTLYLQTEQLPELEKYTRLHYDMDINLEGIETVAHLLRQVHGLQKVIIQLQNKLSAYES